MIEGPPIQLFKMRLKLILLGAGLLTTLTTPAADLPAPGITEPFLDVIVSASVPGIVSARKLQEGDFAQEGQAILELDKRLEELETERRRLLMEQKKSDYEGTAALFKSTKSVSKDDLEKKEVDYRVAVAEHGIAVEQLRRRSITAPISGTITEILLDPGEACQPYQPVLRLVDTRRCYFITNLEIKSADRLKLNAAVKLEIETGGAPALVEGRVSFLSPVVDPASGLFKVKVLFENPDGRIRPGVAGKLLF